MKLICDGFCEFGLVPKSNTELFCTELKTNLERAATCHGQRIPTNPESVKNVRVSESLFIQSAADDRPMHLHPESIITIAKIISLSVMGATLPKPTEQSPVKTKYRAVL